MIYLAFSDKYDTPFLRNQVVVTNKKRFHHQEETNHNMVTHHGDSDLDRCLNIIPNHYIYIYICHIFQNDNNDTDKCVWGRGVTKKIIGSKSIWFYILTNSSCLTIIPSNVC